MRPANNKSTLKTHFFKSEEAATFVNGGSIADGMCTALVGRIEQE